MCGIVGLVSYKTAVEQGRVERMMAALAHRGPDGSGMWISENGKVGLGHRRLSILDVSTAGAQPMHSASGRYVISFNGEIYNFRELRASLEGAGISFHSHSDTEVMLAGFEVWGVRETIEKLVGMFAFALFDQQENLFHLVRDRIGIKPLFYGVVNGVLAFASELRPVVIGHGVMPRVSQRALTEFLRLGYVPSPLSILDGIKKLPAGTMVTLTGETLSEPNAYWRVTDAMEAGRRNRFVDEKEALAELEAQLRASVGSHMVSDVPIGAFLSGGIDSSMVVAMMQEQSATPIKTFSIGFKEAGFNEAEHAALVARHLGTEHTELYVTDEDARSVIPKLPNLYDEPFADVSQIPTFLVSQLARQQVTVALSGDGGDELFGGYNRYVFVASFWKKLSALPIGLRKAVASVLSGVRPEMWDAWFARLAPVLPKRFSPALPGQKMHKIAAILPCASLLSLHRTLVAQWANPELAQNAMEASCPSLWEEVLLDMSGMTDAEQQMGWDMQTYLVDDILTKVDRASMHVGLEARVPLLDHRLVEFAWRVPLSMKLREGSGKWLLKQLLYRYVPKHLVERPKMGFSVPIDAWLRGPLRAWAEPYLAESRLRSEGYLNSVVIAQTWEDHLKGSVDRGGALWTVLMFQIWLERSRSWV